MKAVMPCLQVDENGIGCFIDPETNVKVAFRTQKGECKSTTVKNGIVK